MKKIILLSTLVNLLILGNPYCISSQSVGVSGFGLVPNSSALLDVDAAGMTPKGVLIPRITLTSTTDKVTIATPANSLLVYNTGTGALTPAGYYYNQGTTGSPNWVSFLTSIVANSSSSAGVVATGSGQNSQVWKTDASGNPAWRVDAGSSGGSGRPSQWGTGSGSTMNWMTCVTTCSNSSEGGFTDWYMPSLAQWFELDAIVSDGSFTGYYWTSSGTVFTYFDIVRPSDGDLQPYLNSDPLYCRCVR